LGVGVALDSWENISLRPALRTKASYHKRA
jgi:hypothetical protein